MIVIDEMDRKILDVLQVEGRITNLELAERIGLSSAPCMRRVRTLEETGVINSYVALVDAARVGLGHPRSSDIYLPDHRSGAILFGPHGPGGRNSPA